MEGNYTNFIICEGYLKKLKHSPLTRMFGKTNQRWFMINFDEKIFGYKLKEKEFNLTQKFSFEEITAFRDKLDKDKISQSDWKFGFEVDCGGQTFTLFAKDQIDCDRWISAFSKILKIPGKQHPSIPEEVFELALEKFYYPFLEEKVVNRKKLKRALQKKKEANDKYMKRILKDIEESRQGGGTKGILYDKNLTALIKEADIKVDNLFIELDETVNPKNKKPNKIEKTNGRAVVSDKPSESSANDSKKTGINQLKKAKRALKSNTSLYDINENEENSLDANQREISIDPGMKQTDNRYGQVKPATAEDRKKDEKAKEIQENKIRFGQVKSSDITEKENSNENPKKKSKGRKKNTQKDEEIDEDYKYFQSEQFNDYVRKKLGNPPVETLPVKKENSNNKKIIINFNNDDLLDWNIYDENKRVMDKTKLNSIKAIFNKDVKEPKNFQIETVNKYIIRPEPRREVAIEELHLKKGSDTKDESKFFKVLPDHESSSNDFSSSFLNVKKFFLDEKLEIKPTKAENFTINSNQKFGMLQKQSINNITVEKSRDKNLIPANINMNINVNITPDLKRVKNLGSGSLNPNSNKKNKELLYDLEKNEIFYGVNNKSKDNNNLNDSNKYFNNNDDFFSNQKNDSKDNKNPQNKIDKNMIKGDFNLTPEKLKNLEKKLFSQTTNQNVNQSLNETHNNNNSIQPYVKKTLNKRTKY